MSHTLRELRTFTDLVYSKNKVLSCTDWHPRLKNIVTVSCMENITYDQRVELSGKPRSGYILVWNFGDLIHPEMVLETPSETVVFRYNPESPQILVAGTISGQVKRIISPPPIFSLPFILL